MAQFKDNPLYRRVFPEDDSSSLPVFYAPAQDTEYHKSRELAMQRQDMYSRCGVSPGVLKSFASELIQRANNEINAKTLRTDIGVIGNNLLYRMSNIVDEDCIMRMAAIGVFLEGENPDVVNEAWTQKKIRLAQEHPEARDFFLTWGIALTPEYAAICRGLQVEEYLANRKEALNGLTLQNTLTS